VPGPIKPTNPTSNPAPKPASQLLSQQGQVPSGKVPSKRERDVHEARMHLSEGRKKEAAEIVDKLRYKHGKDPEILTLSGLVCEQQFRNKEAVAYGEKSAAIRPHPETYFLLARVYRVMGETDKSLAACDALERLGSLGDILPVLRAGALEEAGRFDEAKAVLDPFIEALESAGKPVPNPALVERSKLLVQFKQLDEAIELIDRTLETPNAPDELKRNQYHLRAKASDRKKNYAEAFDSASKANEYEKLEFSPELYEEQVTALIENWSRETMADFPVSACDSELPVFVAGMPRSGTSLIDQIIDAHPKASGVGELNSIERFAYELANAWDPSKGPGKQFGRLDARRWTKTAEAYVKEISALAPPGTERVVNKALGNNKLVGLIAKLFPKTRIIHAIRDPRDVAISCYMGGFNNRLHPWTTQIDWAAQAWAQSRRMMEHWKQALDVPILDVHYERLVADPQNEFPRIIDFLGLEWDDRCFEFHKTRRTVRTLSYDQVNRPIYTSSSGRHANYAEQIEGIEFPEYDPGL